MKLDCCWLLRYHRYFHFYSFFLKDHSPNVFIYFFTASLPVAVWGPSRLGYLGVPNGPLVLCQLCDDAQCHPYEPL